MKGRELNDLLLRCGRVREPGMGLGKCCSLALARRWAGEAGDQASMGGQKPSLSLLLLLQFYCIRDGGVRVCSCGGMSTLRKVKMVTLAWGEEADEGGFADWSPEESAREAN